MELMEAIYNRRSVRFYTEETVDKDIINKLIKAGIQAPSAMNVQLIANAADDGGPRWPSIYEPEWPNLAGEPGYDPAKAAPAPVFEPHNHAACDQA